MVMIMIIKIESSQENNDDHYYSIEFKKPPPTPPPNQQQIWRRKELEKGGDADLAGEKVLHEGLFEIIQF